MAGLGFRTFEAGDVLTAAQVQNFLQDQVVMVFADASARTAALGVNVSEGMLTYLKDTDAIEFFDGTEFKSVSNPGDITGVIAGTALTGGGLVGDVTLNVDIAAISAAQAGIALTATGNVLDVDFTAIEIDQTQVGLTIVDDATTARTITSADQGKVIRFISSSPITVTINASTDFASGQRVDIIQDGTGVVTVTASGATVAAAEISTTTGSFTIGTQFSAASILSLGSDNYRLIGNIEAVA
jgi:hypothetical protein